MGENGWITSAVGPLVLYIATVIMSAGTFLAVLGYIFWHDRPAKHPKNQGYSKDEQQIFNVRFRL